MIKYVLCSYNVYRVHVHNVKKTYQCKYMYDRKTLIALGGVIFARPMRDRQYLTMLDPIQEKSGAIVVVLVYFATLCGDVFWTASILVALGKLWSTILLYQFVKVHVIHILSFDMYMFILDIVFLLF